MRTLKNCGRKTRTKCATRLSGRQWKVNIEMDVKNMGGARPWSRLNGVRICCTKSFM